MSIQSIHPISRSIGIIASRQTPRCLSRRAQRCCFHDTAIHESGHSRWSKIKHDKGKVDAGRNKIYSVFSHDISLASKLYGPDPALNHQLAAKIATAKRSGFPKANIESAILRGQGRSASGAALEPISIEAILPHNVACIIEAETESKLRSLGEMRVILKTAGGTPTPCAYLFAKKGRIVLEGKRKGGEAWGEDVNEERDNVDVDAVFDAALELGALDVDDVGEGRVRVFTEPADTKSTAEALARDLNLDIADSCIFWDGVEDTLVEVQDDGAVGDLVGLLDELEDKEAGLQAVYMNVKPGEKVSEGAWTELMSRLNA